MSPFRGWHLPNLRGRYVETLTSASYLTLLFLALQFGSAQPMVWRVVVGLLATISFFAWTSTWTRARAIADVATSRIGSAAQGYVELLGKGSADPEHLLRSPYSGIPCIWYRYTVFEKTSDDHQWREISRDTSWSTFELRDATGTCRVDPDDAEIVGQQLRTSIEGQYKQVEELLFGGSPLYVLGEFTTIGGAHTPLSHSEDVSALLADWKKDPTRLKQRFDLDKNGELDMREWEFSRRLAKKTVDNQHRALRNDPGVHIMRAPRNGRLFLLSSLPPQKLRHRYQLWAALHLAVFVCAVAVWVWRL